MSSGGPRPAIFRGVQPGGGQRRLGKHAIGAAENINFDFPAEHGVQGVCRAVAAACWSPPPMTREPSPFFMRAVGVSAAAGVAAAIHTTMADRRRGKHRIGFSAIMEHYSITIK